MRLARRTTKGKRQRQTVILPVRASSTEYTLLYLPEKPIIVANAWYLSSATVVANDVAVMICRADRADGSNELSLFALGQHQPTAGVVYPLEPTVESKRITAEQRMMVKVVSTVETDFYITVEVEYYEE